MTEEERLKRNAYMRNWIAKNREKCNARAKAYRASLTPEEKKRHSQMKAEWAKSQPLEYQEQRKQYLREHMRKKRATPEGALREAEVQKRFRDANRERLNAAMRERRKNPTPEQRRKKSEADRKYRQKWTEEKKEKDRLRHLEQRRANPDRHNANNQRRRALKVGNGGSYTAAEWYQVKEDADFKCLRCGRCEPDIKLTVDHVVPIIKGGKNDIANIQPLCYSCNASKQDRIIDYRMARAA